MAADRRREEIRNGCGERCSGARGLPIPKNKEGGRSCFLGKQSREADLDVVSLAVDVGDGGRQGRNGAASLINMGGDPRLPGEVSLVIVPGSTAAIQTADVAFVRQAKQELTKARK